MLRIDGRVLTAAVVGLFLVGAGAGFFVGGGLGSAGPSDAGPNPGTPTAIEPPDESTPTATQSPTAPGTTVVTASPTAGPTATATPTAVPTATPTPTATARPTATATRTPKLIRRFDTGKIKRILVDKINDWRANRGYPRFHTKAESMKRVRKMAENHSVEMADAGVIYHTIDNRSSADRYWQYDVYNVCKFKKRNANYVVLPTMNRLEVLDKTYAGKRYETKDGTYRYNADEREVAQAIFQQWKTTQPYKSRLLYYNATHLGIGIEMTRNNEVYVTGNLCGISGFQNKEAE
jgi:uncharacterized protein YkwD